MKAPRDCVGITISSSAVAIAAAAAAWSIFSTLGNQRLTVDAFQMDRTIIQRIPYDKYQQPKHRQDCFLSQISIGEMEVTEKFKITPTRDRAKTSHTLLCMNSGSGGEETESSTKFSLATINIQLVVQNLANQALLGYPIWTGGDGFTVLSEQTNLGIISLILGVVGVIPMLALSRAIETSESPFVSGLNLSTNMAVLRLFGPASQPILAFFVSLLMATTTGIVEETLFRGQSLPAFAYSYGDGNILTGAFLSTLLFAVLHTNPLGFFKGREAFIDNFALLLLQIINGGIFAFLYLLTGNLAVPIITHTLYDLYIFYKTHLVDVAGQMEYAEEEALMPVCSSNTIEEKWVGKYGEDWLKEAKEGFYLMDTNRDGELSRKELRIALYSYGINLSKVESEEIKRAVDTDGSGSIDFDEYLEFIGPTAGSRTKAVRNTLLGPI